jgi:hypothetical protein
MDAEKAIEALFATLSVVSNENINLTESEKVLLCWHFCLGHLSFHKVQFLMCSGVLASSKASRLHGRLSTVFSTKVCCLHVWQTNLMSGSWKKFPR